MSDTRLLGRCKDRDPTAWRELFDSYVSAVYRWAMFLGLDSNEAEEVTQEVFITLAKRIGDCRSEKQLPAWLFQITRRHTANRRRHSWFKRVVLMDVGRRDSSSFSADNAEGIAIAHDLHAVLKKMPLKLTEILILHDLDGYSRSEIAQLLRIPKGTVASRLKKARSFVKQAWEPRGAAS